MADIHQEARELFLRVKTPSEVAADRARFKAALHEIEMAFGGHSPMYALHCVDVPTITAQDVRDEVNPLLDDIQRLARDALGPDSIWSDAPKAGSAT